MRGVDPREAAIGCEVTVARVAVNVVIGAVSCLLVVAVAIGAGAGERSEVRRSASRPSPGGVRALPHRARRLSGGGDGGRRSRSRLQRAQAARSATTCRRSVATSLVSEVRAAYRDENGEIHQLTAARRLGSSTRSSTSSRTRTHGCQPVMPPEANIIARRVPIPIFGAGLVEAIADETILALEDPDDRNADGISGRAALVVDMGTGRRARRPVRLEGAARDAAHLQRRRVPQRDGDHQRAVPGRSWPPACRPAQMKQCDPIPDPEDVADPRTRLAAIDNFEAFMKFLAPPPRGPIDDRRGPAKQIFTRHRLRGVPRAGPADRRRRPSVVPRKAVPLFSDLLLHDVGTGDHIPQASARRRSFGRRRSGACGSAVRSCTTAAPARWKRRSPATHGEAEGVRRRFDAVEPRRSARR